METCVSEAAVGQDGSRQPAVDELDALEDGVFEDHARELAVLEATIAESRTNKACACQAQGPHGALAEFDINNGVAGGLPVEFAAFPARLIVQHRVDHCIELRRNLRAPRHEPNLPVQRVAPVRWTATLTAFTRSIATAATATRSRP